jgi:hypothetical protein
MIQKNIQRSRFWTENTIVSRTHIDLCPHKISARLCRPFSKYKGDKVRFLKIVIFRAPRKKFAKIRNYIFFENGLRWFIEKCLLYQIHRNWAESDDLDWAAHPRNGRGLHGLAHMNNGRISLCPITLVPLSMSLLIENICKQRTAFLIHVSREMFSASNACEY